MEKVITDTQAAILNATLDAVAEHGFHGAPTSMIASKAGVGVGSIYRYFKDKDELIHAVHRSLEARIEPVLLEGYSREMPIREQFIHLCSRIVRYLVDNKKEFLFMEHYYNSPYGVEKRRAKLFDERSCCSEAGHPFNVLFKEGKAAQIIKDVPMVLLFALTFSPIMSLVKDHINGFVDLGDAAVVRTTVESCWDAVKR